MRNKPIELFCQAVIVGAVLGFILAGMTFTIFVNSILIFCLIFSIGIIFSKSTLAVFGLSGAVMMFARMVWIIHHIINQ